MNQTPSTNETPVYAGDDYADLLSKIEWDIRHGIAPHAIFADQNLGSLIYHLSMAREAAQRIWGR